MAFTVAFDLETTTGAPNLCKHCKEEMFAEQAADGELMCSKCGVIDKRWNFSNPNWKDHLPFLISCAAVSIIEPEFNADGSDLVRSKVWHGNVDDEYNQSMTPPEIEEMINDLYSYHASGNTIVAHNGVDFDWRILGVYAAHPDTSKGLLSKVNEMAAASIDLSLQALEMKGFRLGLDAICKGMGVEGKKKTVAKKDGTIIKNMSGWMAPELWNTGEHEAVIEYLLEDVFSLSRLMIVLRKSNDLYWITGKGKKRSFPYSRMTVRDICRREQGFKLDNQPAKAEITDWMLMNFLD